MEPTTITYEKTASIVDDMQKIIEAARTRAYQAINVLLVQRNCLLGKRIAEEVMQGEDRAEYGAKMISHLSQELTGIYGKGFTKTNLYSYYSFYNASLRFSTRCVENLNLPSLGAIIAR